MKRLCLIFILMIFSSALVHAYDYENRRRQQARDSGELLNVTKQKEVQTKAQKKQRAVKRKMNQEKRRASRTLGIRNNQGDVVNMQ